MAGARPPIVARAATEDLDRLGETLGSYRILDVLGRGGMGNVYRAEHVKLGREVALKLLRGDYASRRDAVARFFQEARTVNRVRHRNIVDVTDFVELDDGTTFIIMELLTGQSLGNWARTGIDLPRALAVLVQICDGLAAAHEIGVIHRDLKPDNIFIVPTADGAELVKLLDFGVAKLVNRDDEDLGFQTVAGSVIGTPAYMSPEQAGGMPVDPRSDIYSLGAIMYELFCGQPMFQGRSFGEYVRKHLVEMPPPPRATPAGAQLDPRIDALIMKCLEKDPDQRFAAIGELRDALLALLGGMETYLPGLAALSASGVRIGASLAPGVVSIASLPQPHAPQPPAHAMQLPAYVSAVRSPSQAARPSHGSHASGAHPPQAAYAAPSSAYAANASLPALYGGEHAPTPTRSTPLWVWIVGGALAVGLGTGAAIWYAGRGDRPASPAPTAVATPSVDQPAPIAEPGPEPRVEPGPPPPTTTLPPPPPPTTTLEVKLDSTPAGDVYADGGAAALCHTPCTHTIDPRDGGSPDQRRYVVRTAGYQDGPIVVDLKGAQREFRVALEPTPPDEPVAKPTAKPGGRPRPVTAVRRPTAKPTAKPDEPTRPAEPVARPDTKPDNPDLIDPGPGKKPKKPGTIDSADTLDPFRKSPK
jgi:serine/threonine-protein kinase